MTSIPASLIITANTKTAFDEAVLSSDIPVVVDFWAPWCRPCLALAPEIEHLALAHQDQIKVVKVDVDQNPEVAQAYKIQSIPLVGLFKDGALVATSLGAKPYRALVSDLGI